MGSPYINTVHRDHVREFLAHGDWVKETKLQMECERRVAPEIALRRQHRSGTKYPELSQNVRHGELLIAKDRIREMIDARILERRTNGKGVEYRICKEHNIFSDELRQRADAIRGLQRRIAADVVEIGGVLKRVKALIGHGGWGPWLAAELGWSDKTAQNYMSTHDAFGKIEKFSDLQFGQSAMYLLAAPSTPADARAEAIDRARRGEKITHKVAKRIVASKSPLRRDDPPSPAVDNPDNTKMIAAVDKGKLDVGKAAEIAKTLPKTDQEAAIVAEATTYVDHVGNHLTVEQSQIFGDEYLFDDLIEHLAEVRRGVKALRKLPAGKNIIHTITINRLIRELKSELEEARPYAICTYCEGRGGTCCHETGITTKSFFDQAPKPEETEV